LYLAHINGTAAGKEWDAQARVHVTNRASTLFIQFITGFFRAAAAFNEGPLVVAVRACIGAVGIGITRCILAIVGVWITDLIPVALVIIATSGNAIANACILEITELAFRALSVIHAEHTPVRSRAGRTASAPAAAHTGIATNAVITAHSRWTAAGGIITCCESVRAERRQKESSNSGFQSTQGNSLITQAGYVYYYIGTNRPLSGGDKGLDTT
jgi:hypothetical protein